MDVGTENDVSTERDRETVTRETEKSDSSAGFWRGEEVEAYETGQRLMVEQKAAVLANIVRIVGYFCKKRAFVSPVILDVGCGTGTLANMLLETIGGCRVTGVDGSEEMLAAFRRNCHSRFPERTTLIHSDFNKGSFWHPMMNDHYDIIVSSMALHYLSDDGVGIFFKGARRRLSDGGIFTACIGNLSNLREIREMAYHFKLEFAYQNRKENGYEGTFSDFKADLKSRMAELCINWRTPGSYLTALEEAGFHEVELVWHLWLKSIYVALKRPAVR